MKDRRVVGPFAVVGRDTELADLDARLRSHRLVTVVGPGGVGKTTLARAAARRAAARFPLGVRFVDLARIDAPDAVPGSFAGQLGFASFEALLASPVDQPALVIADNCEHVLDAAAMAIDQLLERCEMPTVLATSRSPLSLPGETVCALAPLAVPAVDDPAAGDAPVVRLFLARARDAGAQLADRDLAAVVPLCARLDGLPLAVEIAAARTRGMAVAELLARVEDGVDVLQRRRFRGSARHRSVSDVIRWSIDLLGAPEVDLLERLAVLNGAFSRATAERASADATVFEAAFDDLVHASLVAVDTSDDVTRYRLLDVVRRFALDRLRARGDLEDRYDRFVDQVLAAAWARLVGSGLPTSLRDAVAELDDVATAVRWCLDHDREPRRALRLCAALLVIIEQGRAADIAALARDVFARWPDAVATGAPGAAEAAATLANGENLTGNPQRGLRLARTALATVAGPGLAAVTLRQAIGDCSVALGDRRAAEAAYAEAAAIARRTGRVPHALELELARAQLCADAGDVAAALAAIDATAAEAEAVGATLTAVWASAVRAWVTVRTGPAETLIDASLAACRAAGYGNGVAANLRSLVFCRVLANDLDGATDALVLLREHILGLRSLANLRMLVDAAATLAHRAAHPAWSSLAATVGALPSATLLAAGEYAVVPLPATAAEPLSARACLDVVAALVADLKARPATPALMHRTGDVWTIAFAGKRVTVRASKGLTTLAELVAAPHRELHCLDLMDAGVEQRSTGEVIDATARRRYEERIRELQGEIDAAEADHDLARAERAQVEFDALVEHLAAALGHVGKARRAGDTAERARSAVTHRVRSAVRQLGEVHEPLARHLKLAVATGTYCCYRPEHPVEWDVRFTS